MRKLCILAILAVFFAGFGFSVVRMERLRATGADMLLALAPVDPRALLMGDYMELDYTVNNAIRNALRGKPAGSLSFRDRSEGITASGKAVVRLSVAAEERRNAPGDFAAGFPAVVFARLDDGTPLAPGEFLLGYKARGRRVVTAAPSFYFQEGDAAVYERARFGRVKVDGNGKTLLVALCDEEGRDLEPERKTEGNNGRGNE